MLKCVPYYLMDPSLAGFCLIDSASIFLRFHAVSNILMTCSMYAHLSCASRSQDLSACTARQTVAW
ncbi:hypothetical protein C8Q76DRAFT_710028 [Earliella scabrosa]|nr:hypothetical protein C8Q76DRAFT_710028 [Earliella scabrosa]